MFNLRKPRKVKSNNKTKNLFWFHYPRGTCININISFHIFMLIYSLFPSLFGYIYMLKLQLNEFAYKFGKLNI